MAKAKGAAVQKRGRGQPAWPGPDAQMREVLRKSYGIGLSIDNLAYLCEVAPSVFYRWLDRNTDYWESLKTERARAGSTITRNIFLMATGQHPSQLVPRFQTVVRKVDGKDVRFQEPVIDPRTGEQVLDPGQPHMVSAFYWANNVLGWKDHKVQVEAQVHTTHTEEHKVELELTIKERAQVLQRLGEATAEFVEAGEGGTAKTQ